VTRGCGERVENALYVCVETSPFGVPIDHFLIDPVVPWEGGVLRSPLLVKDGNGISHIVLSVGSKFYPFVPDYVEEARIQGISKRLPKNFDPKPLTPKTSKFLLTHSRAIPRFKYEATASCPKIKDENHECIGALWPLSSLEDMGVKHSVELNGDGLAICKTPSVAYQVAVPSSPEYRGMGSLPYSSGIFLGFPFFHFEWVNKDEKIPPELKKRFEGWELRVCRK